MRLGSILESELLPGPQTSQEGALRPQARAGQSVVLAQGMAPLLRSGVGVLGGGKAGGIREPEAGRLQASNCLWMKMHWVGSRGAGRLFLEVTGSAQPRTHYWEGARKEPKWGWAPEACEWEPRFPDAPQLEVPNGPTLRKQPLHHGAHFPPSLPGNPFLYR